MKHFPFILPFLLACGAAGSEVTVMLRGATMADIGTVKGELGKISGVSEIRPGSLDGDTLTLVLRFSGKGADLADHLAKAGSPLGKIEGFDDKSVKIAFSPGSAPASSAASLPVSAAGKERAPAASPPAPKPEVPSGPPSKDPLAYSLQEIGAGSLAKFDGWTLRQLPDEEWLLLETHPDGKENDFQMIVALGTPEAGVLENLFVEGPAFVQRLLPTARREGDQKKCTFAGDEGRLEDYVAQSQGKTIRVRAVYVRKKDVAVGVLGVGTEETFKIYGRAVEMMAQSITIKQSSPDPALVGTWSRNHSYTSGTFSFVAQRSITFYPNGSFTDSSFTGGGGETGTGSSSAIQKGGDRGKYLRRGNLLTFHYDDGKTWTAEYRIVDGRGLKLDGETFFRQ